MTLVGTEDFCGDLLTWLQERTPLASLPSPVLADLATLLVRRTYPAGTTLVAPDRRPDALAILIQGNVERFYPTPAGRLGASSLLPGYLIGFQELALDRPAAVVVETQSPTEVWHLPAAPFRAWLSRYPEVSLTLAQHLAQEVVELRGQLLFEQERQAALRPFVVPRIKRGIVGTSRYAQRLRQQIKQAAGWPQPVVVFGEPGLQKDNIAALIHFGSVHRRQPLIQLNCATLQASGADLFGRAGGKPGLLGYLGQGTLVLNNIQDLAPELVPRLQTLIQTGRYTPVGRPEDAPGADQPMQARVILIAETTHPLTTAIPQVIRVTPLRVTREDLAAQVKYYLSLYCQTHGIPQPRLTPEALRRLQSYDFPGNLTELENLVARALRQSPGATELGEEVFWPAEVRGRRFRVNLLNSYPWLRQVLRSPWWPDRINYGFTLTVFAFVVAVLFLGPQTRQTNFALNLFWAWWWPVVLLSFPLVGRLWCAICPFMIYGELAQRLSLWIYPRALGRWPRQVAERWGGWCLYGLFTAILLWEELWHLEDTAYLSGALLLLITAGAVVGSLLFERRFWCRYLCPIGGMNGLFAKLAVTELRAQQGICAAACTTYQCYKGGPSLGEGQETGGCPLYSHPAQLVDNRDCVLCMTCLKACPHRSVALNLRPPAIELWTTHTPRASEVALLLLLLGAVFLHHLPELQAWAGRPAVPLSFAEHALWSVVALLGPGLIPLGCYALIPAGRALVNRLGQTWPKPRPWLTLAYGYLPLIWGANLTHYLPLGLGEAGRIVPVTWTTFGAMSPVASPVLVAHPAVIAFLQGTTLISTTLASLWVSQNIARQPFWALLPQHLGILGLGVGLWRLVLG
ncbi:MAG: sigma 54-interacting transcriptional regulator [Gloeomargaritaceae cyanobacterium C42_A2020_066]|nr:sigma 54-interacting transcriptional regulator [Gloeomargaritaceae cyanobacterium C42_A2020_066]